MTGGSEIERMVEAILAGVRNSGSKELDAWRHPERDIRGLAQRDPLNEYKQEAYELFQKLLADLRESVMSQLGHIEIQFQPAVPPPIMQPDLSRLSEIHIDADSGLDDSVTQSPGTIGSAFAAAGALAGLGGDVAEADPRLRPIDPKLLIGVSRNAPCPCGSGKKFKHCHGSF